MACGLHARSLRHTVIVLTIIFLLIGCTSPGKGLWPPRPGSTTHAIYVSLDSWHAMIAFPVSERPEGANTPSLLLPLEEGGVGEGAFEEWGYAERAWYLEGRTGLTGIVRALFWPTDGIIEVGRHDKVWADRTPQPPSALFTFHLSEEGYRRLHEHLRSTVASAESIASTDGSTFYPAVRTYHVFHTCHQYAAEALREAGLPVSPFLAFARSSLAMQLRRAEEIAESRDP
jgi:hypothetical protein